MENNGSYAPSFAPWQRYCDAQILTYNPYAPVLRFSRLAIKQNPDHLSHYYE